ncbi:MAG: DNA repair protein RecN [Gammaproteobacteria bacterium]|nr:DNA repair protein RecN [Gammaproteobacteria bacterium]
MLTHLSIQNFALIDTLSLDFSSGLIIFTGETGAGKSIVMDALALVLGRRGDSSFIRENAEKCEVSGAFDITTNLATQHWLRNNELLSDDEPSCLLLRRLLSRDGRSKSFINGRPVPLQFLRDLGALLVTLHGQHEYQSLLETEGQRHHLDTFGQLSEFVCEVQNCFQQYKTLQKQLLEKKNQYQQLLQQKEFLTFQTEELAALNLQAGELEELEKEQKRLAHRTQLTEGIQFVLTSLDDEQTASALLRTANAKLAHLTEYDEDLIPIHKLLDSAFIQVKEVISSLQHILDKVELNADRLNELDQRLSQAYALARKHHIPAHELFALHQTFSEKINSIETDEKTISILEKELEVSCLAYQEKAACLSKKRKQAAQSLQQLITEYLQKLGMKGGEFNIRVHTQIENRMEMHGQDKIEFWVSTNPGSSLQPLSKIVSGGELSRISLAITVVTVGQDTPLTLIFDEIDAGVGGATAACVGELLKRLSQYHQILCITHAPQVAVFSGQHFSVTKKIQKNTTDISIQPLSNEQKISEIARMIGGATLTPSSLAHAKEMLEL